MIPRFQVVSLLRRHENEASSSSPPEKQDGVEVSNADSCERVAKEEEVQVSLNSQELEPLPEEPSLPGNNNDDDGSRVPVPEDSQPLPQLQLELEAQFQSHLELNDNSNESDLKETLLSQPQPAEEVSSTSSSTYQTDENIPTVPPVLMEE